MSNQAHNEDLYEINKWIDEHYSFEKYESKIKAFITEKYGKEVARKHLVDIKELAHYLDKEM